MMMETYDGLGLQHCSDDRSDSTVEMLSIVDDAWETIDPNPNLQDLFTQFNLAFFGGKLDDVSVAWSNKMKLIAGFCRHPVELGGWCCIQLSRPILEQMSRRTIVETLLHEMIHAHLYISGIRDTGEHGVEFVKEMERLNTLTGANITIHLDYYKEMEALMTHWWWCDRCHCVHRKMIDRPPSTTSKWWAMHKDTCGGEIRKVREPPRKGAKRPRPNSSAPQEVAAPTSAKRAKKE